LVGGAESEFFAHLYEGVTVTSNGADVTPMCMNRFISGYPKTAFYRGPVVTSTMTELWCDYGGAAEWSYPGTTAQKVEWILDGASGSVNYLFRIRNMDAASKDCNTEIRVH